MQDTDYRKAPESPFPAAVHDVEDIVNYVLAHPDEYDTTKITLSGFSAGGCLALQVGTAMGPKVIKGIAGFYACEPLWAPKVI